MSIKPSIIVSRIARKKPKYLKIIKTKPTVDGRLVASWLVEIVNEDNGERLFYGRLRIEDVVKLEKLLEARGYGLYRGNYKPNHLVEYWCYCG